MWVCSGCGETSDDDFEVCWNCGTGQDGSPAGAEFVAEVTASDEESADYVLDTVVSPAQTPLDLGRTSPGAATDDAGCRVLRINHAGQERSSYLNLNTVVLLRREVAGDRRHQALWKVFTSSSELALAVYEDEAVRIIRAMGFSGAINA
jgi:hypothetical protein